MIWIFTEGDGIESGVSPKIFFTLIFRANLELLFVDWEISSNILYVFFRPVFKHHSVKKIFKERIIFAHLFSFYFKEKNIQNAWLWLLMIILPLGLPHKRDFSSFLKNENELLPAILMLSNKVIFLSFVPSPKIELCLFFILFLSQILFFFSIIRMYCVVWLSLKIYLLPFAGILKIKIINWLTSRKEKVSWFLCKLGMKPRICRIFPKNKLCEVDDQLMIIRSN